jgi:uncharacterized protein
LEDADVGVALERGDWTTELPLIRRLAEEGLATAQFNLGQMYDKGEGGLPKDFAAAASWYRKAAEQGIADAQVNLGVMYGAGRGVPQDYVLAHMWLNLAAAGGTKDAAEGRERVTAKMTPAQVAEAQKLAREWKPKCSPSIITAECPVPAARSNRTTSGRP